MQIYSATSLSPALFSFSSLILFFLFIFLVSFFMRNRRLPPGSMGWPYIGEHFQLYAKGPKIFFSKRQIEHGPIFKTHVLRCPCVIVTNPEAIKIILVSRANLFKPTYPYSKEKMIGPEALFFQVGDHHSRLKKVVQAYFNPSALRRSVSDIEQIVLRVVSSWESKTINTLDQMKRFAFNVVLLWAFGDHSDIDTEGIKDLYRRLEEGYNSLPVNLPGFLFRKSMKARKLLNVTLRKVIENRRESQIQSGGLLGELLGSRDNNLSNLSDSQVADNIIGVIFAAQDTTASVLTWILKYLHDNREDLKAVRKEQNEIRRAVKEENRKLAWDDTRRMPLTSRVIQETLRAASVVSFTFREAVEDVELEGYLIPKGWKVLPLFRSLHHSADYFPQPEKFDPSRFEVPPRPNVYMPFGYGVHLCPGSELAKLEMLVLLHHLTTMYRWEVVRNGEDVNCWPFPVPKEGLSLKVSRRSTRNNL